MTAARTTVILLASLLLGARTVEGTPPIPALTGPLVDEAGIVEPSLARAIENLSRELEAKTGAQLAVLTLRSTAPLTAFDFGMQVVESWKLGRTGHDDGLLLMVVVDDREARFFPGYGLEGVLPDGRLGVILDENVLPAFRRGHYGRGIYAGVRTAADLILAAAATESAAASPETRDDGHSAADLVSLALVLFVVIVIAVIVARSSAPGAVRRRHPVFWDGYRGGFGPGGFGRGGFGGGGFRGGGGRFGGGGAGRGW